MIGICFSDQTSSWPPKVGVFGLRAGGRGGGGWSNISWTKWLHLFFLKLCHHITILGICPLTRSHHDLRKRVFPDFPNTQKYGHCASMTESVNWANSVKIRVGQQIPKLSKKEKKTTTNLYFLPKTLWHSFTVAYSGIPWQSFTKAIFFTQLHRSEFHAFLQVCGVGRQSLHKNGFGWTHHFSWWWWWCGGKGGVK